MTKTPEDIIRESEALRKKLYTPVTKKVATGYNEAVRVIVEMIAPLIVSIAIGWYLDEWAGTKPLFFIIFLCFGVATAAVMVKRMNARMNKAEAENIEEVSKSE